MRVAVPAVARTTTRRMPSAAISFYIYPCFFSFIALNKSLVDNNQSDVIVWWFMASFRSRLSVARVPTAMAGFLNRITSTPGKLWPNWLRTVVTGPFSFSFFFFFFSPSRPRPFFGRLRTASVREYPRTQSPSAYFALYPSNWINPW